jgi:hypothetical protein
MLFDATLLRCRVAIASERRVRRSPASCYDRSEHLLWPRRGRSRREALHILCAQGLVVPPCPVVAPREGVPRSQQATSAFRMVAVTATRRPGIGWCCGHRHGYHGAGACRCSVPLSLPAKGAFRSSDHGGRSVTTEASADGQVRGEAQGIRGQGYKLPTAKPLEFFKDWWRRRSTLERPAAAQPPPKPPPVRNPLPEIPRARGPRQATKQTTDHSAHEQRTSPSPPRARNGDGGAALPGGSEAAMAVTHARALPTAMQRSTNRGAPLRRAQTPAWPQTTRLPRARVKQATSCRRTWIGF